MAPAGSNNPGFGMMLVAAVGLLALLTWFFAGVVDERANPNRQVQSQIVNDAVEVVLDADRQGHFVATGQINGRDVRFLVDTGATLVSVPESVADRLGLERAAPIRLETAGGTVQGWMTRLEEVRLGEIVQYDVPGDCRWHRARLDDPARRGASGRNRPVRCAGRHQPGPP